MFTLEDLTKPQTYESNRSLVMQTGHRVWEQMKAAGETDLDWQSWKELAFTGAFAEEIFQAVDEGQRVTEKRSKAEEKKEAAIMALVGTHHDFMTIERDRGGELSGDREPVFARGAGYGRGYFGDHYVRDEKGQDIFIITCPKNQQVIDRLKHAGARWHLKTWRLKVEKHVALKKIVSELPTLIGLQAERDERNRQNAARIELERQQAEKEQQEKLNQLNLAGVAEAKEWLRGYVSQGMYLSANGYHLTASLKVKLGPIWFERFRETMRSIGRWSGTEWIIGGRNWERVRSLAIEMDAAIETSRKQREAQEAEAAQKRRDLDAQVGRIYHTERNVDRSHQMLSEITREGRIYRLEKIQSAGPEYGSDGDWMVSASYLPLSDEEQARTVAQIQDRRAADDRRRQAKVEFDTIVKSLSEIADKIPAPWPPIIERVFSQDRNRDPFVSILLVDTPTDETPGRVIISYHASDYDVDSLASISTEQLGRLRELSSILRSNS